MDQDQDGSVERVPLGDGLARVLEGAVPVDAVGVAADLLPQRHMAAVDVNGGRGRRRARIAEARQDDQDDGVLPPVHAQVHLEYLVELDAGGVVHRRRLPPLDDAPRLGDEQHLSHQFKLGVFHFHSNAHKFKLNLADWSGIETEYL